MPGRLPRVTDVFLYADETGNLDYEAGVGNGESPYFGFGTAAFTGDHGAQLFRGLATRAALSAAGLDLPGGFHAKNDTTLTRQAMFDLIQASAPRFDMTFLCKPNAYQSVKDRGQMYLYKMAWYLHLKEVALRVSSSTDKLYVVAGTFGTKRRATEARQALTDVCHQVNRDITLCVWESASSWGLQVADYGLWAAHRNMVGRSSGWFHDAVEPNIRTSFRPWGEPRPA